MPHWLIALGSIVGLITGVYTLWDRVVRRRPRIWFSRSIERKDGIVAKVRNPDEQDIALIGISVRPRIYDVANSWQFDQLVWAAMDESSYRLVRPGEAIELPIRTRTQNGKEMDQQDCDVLFTVYWRRTSSMRLRRIPLWLRVRTSDITRLKGAEV